jgi:putative transposase
LVFAANYRRGVFDTQILNRCEQVIAQVCADFGATLAEFNGEQDHVHLLAAYSPQVSLCHLVDSFNGVSSRCAACSGPRHTSPGYAVARHCPHSGTYITNQKRPD